MVERKRLREIGASCHLWSCKKRSYIYRVDFARLLSDAFIALRRSANLSVASPTSLLLQGRSRRISSSSHSAALSRVTNSLTLILVTSGHQCDVERWPFCRDTKLVVTPTYKHCPSAPKCQYTTGVCASGKVRIPVPLQCEHGFDDSYSTPRARSWSRQGMSMSGILGFSYIHTQNRRST